MKHIFFRKSFGSRTDFFALVFDRLVPGLIALAPDAMKIGLTERSNPGFTVLPLRPENLLVVSTWGSIDPVEISRILAQDRGAVFGYRVEESYPRRYTRTWPNGTRSPGDILLTLLAKNRRLSPEAFMHEWHGVHTPMALRIHPMWSYERNVVTAAVTPGAPAFQGIVEEHYRELGEITNPVRMFGGRARFLPNMLEVARHSSHFLDLRTTENYLIAEWHLLG